MDAEAARLKGELSRVVAHRSALQEALAAAEGDLAAMRREGGRQRAHIADLHGALNAARAERDRLETALGARKAVSEPEPSSVSPPRLRSLPAAAVIEARNLCKTYRIPSERVETLKESVLHPLRSSRTRQLEALRDVSFDVRRGEFFGIAGANGSGKSTLLKLLADVYGPDSGTIRTAGRVAPFIELGVGLNPEFAAYDNVVISGVMMGLEPEEARARYPEIIEFAGLEDFTELKLKNYSSGMRVRLAFSVMVQVDADILLIDEVLAVGDAEFREKCLERTHRLRSEGKTVILVTHSMDALAKECDRAILLREGEIVCEGDPSEVARRYLSESAPPERPGDEGKVLQLVEG